MKLKPIELLTVHLLRGESRKVGRLAYKSGEILFEYDPEFIASGIQLSPFTLPLNSKVYRGDPHLFDGLFGVFNDSLPDGWGRLLLDRAVEKYGIHRGQLTPLDRLAHVGHHGMGALAYEPDQSLTDDKDEILDLERIASDAETVLSGDQDQMVEKLYKLNGASSGARPKVVALVSEDKKKIIHGQAKFSKKYSHWMIKFPSANDPNDAGRIEYAYSLMVKSSGIEMPETYLFKAKSKRFFGIKRFDRVGNQPIHMHSLSGLIGNDHRIPSLDYDTMLKVTFGLTKDFKQVQKAFALTCFNVLAHNRDDHSKNFSFLLNEENQWNFAPAYDITFAFGPGNEQSMTVLGEGKDPGVKDLSALAKKHSIKNADSIISRVQSGVARWKEFAEDSGVTKKSTAMIGRKIDAISKIGVPKTTKPKKANATKKSKKTTSKPTKRRPDKRKIMTWFNKHHVVSEGSENFDNDRHKINVKPVIQKQFPDATDRMVDRVTDELEAVGSWSKF